jgi:hypothetical protein
MEFHEVIFQVFRKAIGLGVPLVTKVAEQRRGHVWMESNVAERDDVLDGFPKSLSHDWPNTQRCLCMSRRFARIRSVHVATA